MEDEEVPSDIQSTGKSDAEDKEGNTSYQIILFG